jgi:hypothetical protein
MSSSAMAAKSSASAIGSWGPALPLGLALMAFLAGGVLVERSPRFAAQRRACRDPTVPASLLRYGTLGDALRELNLLVTVPDPEATDVPAFGMADGDGVQRGFFRKKRRPTPYRHQVSEGAESLPSSRILAAAELNRPMPVLSLVVDESDLTDPERGVLTRDPGKGPERERLAYASCFTNGALAWGSATGIRAHGETPHRMPPPGLRLYFRDLYGIPQLPTSMLTGLGGEPVVTLVLRRRPYVNTVAYAIARQIGAQAVPCTPALVYLNGNPLGLYELTAHLSRRQLSGLFGHEDFHLIKYKGQSESRSTRAYLRLLRHQLPAMEHVTMDRLGELVDVDNLVRHLFSIIFCGTTNWRQGVLARDGRNNALAWFWVNWDMDQSFVDLAGRHRVTTREPWEQEALDLVLVNRKWWQKEFVPAKDLRADLFQALLRDDPAFPRYFVDLCMDALNHRIPPEFLGARIDECIRVETGRGAGEGVMESLLAIRKFLTHRPDHVRHELQARFDRGPLSRVRIHAPVELRYTVDGHAKQGAYEGVYFQDSEVRMDVQAESRAVFSHWEVNGRPIEGLRVATPAVTDMDVRAVLR